MTLDAEVGNSHLHVAIIQAIELADRLNVNIRFEFNDVFMVVNRDSDFEKVIAKYEKEKAKEVA